MAKENDREDPKKFGLPPTPFLYHLDQVATILNVPLSDFLDTYAYFLSRSSGKKVFRKITVVNINPNPDEEPHWRVSEGELMRWMKLMGFTIYSSGRVI